MAKLIIEENTIRIEQDAGGLGRRKRLEVVTGRELRRRHRRWEAFKWQALYNIVLCFMCVVTLAMFVYCVSLQSSCDMKQRTLMRMEEQLEEQRLENEAVMDSIVELTNLELIRQIAVEELGMVEQSEENVLTYKKNEAEYVRQYDDIPRY